MFTRRDAWSCLTKKKTKSSGPMELDTLHMSLKDNVTVDVPESTEQPFFFSPKANNLANTLREGRFPGTCRHCGQLDTISECRQKDEEVRKKG